MDALQMTISLIIAKLHNMLSEQRHEFQRNEDKDKLKNAIRDLQSMVTPKPNDQQQEHPSATVKPEFLMKAEDTIDRFPMEVSQPPRPGKGPADTECTLSICCPLPLRTPRRGNDRIAEDLIDVVEKLSSWAREQPHRVLVNPDAEGPPSSSSRCPPPQERNSNGESDIVGRKESVDSLVMQLIKGDGLNLHVISVFGDEAIGKTALVRDVYSRAEVRNHFDYFAWIRVPEKPDLVHLMVDLFKQVKSQELLRQVMSRELIDVDSMKEQEELSDELQRILMKRRYLIVLDNLRTCDHMDSLMMLLADSRNGSRVIITTPEAGIHTYMDPWYSRHLELKALGQKQREDLLKKCLGAEINMEVHSPAEAGLMNLAEKILSKCGGCPARILLLGGLLSVTKPCGRTMLLNKIPDSPTLKDIVFLSYHELPYWLKPCALYLALFPKESEISTRRLFRLWLAEGLLFLSSETPASICLAKDRFGELVSRNLVHVVRRKSDGSVRTCRLPGMLYNFFSQMAKESGYFQICGSSDCQTFANEEKFIAPRIAIYKDIEVEEATVRTSSLVVGQQQKSSSNKDALAPYSIEQLRSYVSFNTSKVRTHSSEIETPFKALLSTRDPALLRVLDLEGVYKPALPEQLGKKALNLRYLGLRWTALESLPKSVCHLPNLETLDMKYTNITQVPSSIWEAKNLQHLYMNGVCFDDYINHDDRTLNCKIRTVSGLLIISAESHMLTVLGKLTGLRKLALTCYPAVVRDATKKISKLESLKSLRLRFIGEVRWTTSGLGLGNLRGLESLYLVGLLRFECLISFPSNLTVLTLSMSKLRGDIMAVLGKLKNLTTLRLFAGAYSSKALSCRGQAFPRLRILKLWKLEELRRWTIEGNAMPILEELEIKDCKRLKEIDGLQHIEKLEEVVLVKVKDKLVQSVKETCSHSQRKIQWITKELLKSEADDGDEDGDEGDISPRIHSFHCTSDISTSVFSVTHTQSPDGADSYSMSFNPPSAGLNIFYGSYKKK